MLGLKRSGQSWDTQYEVMAVNWGKLSKVYLFRFSLSQPLFVSRDKDAPFLWEQGGHLSHEGFMTCFREGRRKGQCDGSASAVFSNFFSLKFSICKVIGLKFTNDGMCRFFIGLFLIWHRHEDNRLLGYLT